jgi:hypothetical protein
LNIEGALERFLKNNTKLKAIHGGRACFGMAPEGWLAPYQTFFMISDESENRRLTVPRPRIQINNYGQTNSQVIELADALYEVLTPYVGDMYGVKIIDARYDDFRDDFNTLPPNRITDYFIKYRLE